MERTATVERSPDLYTITLPPGMLLCVNSVGAMRLLNRTRVTIWNYVKNNQLRSFSIAGNIAIPLVDIAAILGATEMQVYNVAVSYRLPIYQVYPEGG